MTRIKCEANPAMLRNLTENEVGVLLYGTRGNSPGRAALGNLIRGEIRRLTAPVSQRAFDLLTVALAVTAADTFVKRDSTADGWTREFELSIPVAEPEAWIAVQKPLQTALSFLSGDVWHIDIIGNGPIAPVPLPLNAKHNKIHVKGRNCVCLFSGGLDSSIGVLNLIAQGQSPILVSHSYRGDKLCQDKISNQFPQELSRFSSNLSPTSGLPAEPSMRTRSFNFLAFGAVVASAVSAASDNPAIDLFIPENGLISLNVPLTRRRLGSLSTRTTHPYYLNLVQKIFNVLEIPATIKNPYKFSTKGEMLSSCTDRTTLERIASESVSCGKWKRANLQCGRCVPCIIRRASFHAAGILDETRYRRDLPTVYAEENDHDDLLALMLAVKKAQRGDNASWLALSGPLPEANEERIQYLDVFERGLQEVASYLQSQRLI